MLVTNVPIKNQPKIRPVLCTSTFVALHLAWSDQTKRNPPSQFVYNGLRTTSNLAFRKRDT